MNSALWTYSHMTIDTAHPHPAAKIYQCFLFVSTMGDSFLKEHSTMEAVHEILPSDSLVPVF